MGKFVRGEIKMSGGPKYFDARNALILLLSVPHSVRLYSVYVRVVETHEIRLLSESAGN